MERHPQTRRITLFALLSLPLANPNPTPRVVGFCGLVDAMPDVGGLPVVGVAA